MKQEQSFNRRILIIDDNPNIHNDFREILETKSDNIDGLAEATEAILGSEAKSSMQEGFQIDSAFQGHEGLELIKKAIHEERPYSLVFVDMRMPPGLDGLQTIEHIWQADSKIQVIICTAYSDYSLGEITERLGKSENLLILKKPFDIVEVEQLAIALTKKWNLNEQAIQKNEQLELLVKERTLQLVNANKQLTEMLRQIENVNQELQTFAYAASHDLREPLRKIYSFGQLLASSAKCKLDEDEQENLGFMIDGANRMEKLIEALLTYSRVGIREGGFEKVDLNLLIEELMEFDLSLKIQETGAKILIPEKLHSVTGDSTQLRQLLQNLIGNALKYKRKDTISELIIRSQLLDDSIVRVEIQDNGIGIKEEHFQNIFVMFKRLHSRDEYEGTGIGLAICKKIVEKHNGTIGVSSTYGEGSTFWFTVPDADINKNNIKEISKFEIDV